MKRGLVMAAALVGYMALARRRIHARSGRTPAGTTLGLIVALTLAVAACGESSQPRPNSNGLIGNDLRAAYLDAEKGFYERHPQLTSRDQAECFQSSRVISSSIARAQYREECLELREARRQGR